MKLNTVMLGSENVKQLADFYTKILGEPGWHDGDWYGFDVGGCYLMIGPHDKVKGTNPSPERIIMNFETAAVKAEFERIKDLGAKVIAKPYSPSEAEGALLATFADPDGNYFQLASPWKS